MKQVYYKDGVMVARPKQLVYNGSTYVPPTDEVLIAAGYTIKRIETPEPKQPTDDERYRARVVDLIRMQYSVDDELAFLRQRESKAKEFDSYFTFCEACKKQAYEEIYGKEPPANLSPKEDK